MESRKYLKPAKKPETRNLAIKELTRDQQNDIFASTGAAICILLNMMVIAILCVSRNAEIWCHLPRVVEARAENSDQWPMWEEE